MKGPSVFQFIPNFNIVHSFIPDYMHCVPLGVVKYVASLWFDSENSSKPCYIGNKMEEIDEILTSINVPNEVTRLPRGLQERKYWKANEFRALVLFFLLPVFCTFQKYCNMQHFLLLINSIHLLLDEPVRRNQLNQIHLSLCKFVLSMEHLYGKQYVTYNCHQLTHLVQSVRSFGPLGGISAFQFESFIGKLKMLVCGTRHAPLQICRKYLLWHDLPRLKKEYGVEDDDCDSSVVDFLDHLMLEPKRFNSQSQKFASAAIGIGVSFPTILTQTQRDAIIEKTDLTQEQIPLQISGYHRLIARGFFLTTSIYASKFHRDNSLVKLSDGRFARIVSIGSFKTCICDEMNCGCLETAVIFLDHFMIVRRRPLVEDRQLGISSHDRFSEFRETHDCIVCFPNDIYRKCVKVSIGGKQFLVPVPMTVESD